MLAGSLLLAACASSATAQAEPSPSGTGWLLMATGSVAPSPTVSFAPRVRAADATLPPTASAPATPTPSGSACESSGFRGGAIDGLTVTPGRTSAVVKWFHPQDANLVQYRIIAVSQDLVSGPQPETPGWITVTPGRCGWMTATVSGLTAGTPYVFSVDGVWTRRGMDGTYARTVARSGVVSTT
ncbi:hypothetical protein Ate01nite_31640 [Actinoplanes teichomyceticus]|nr:hypothetical protein Ate01nite_31640 [Actinoplanes teichomyceticus]